MTTVTAAPAKGPASTLKLADWITFGLRVIAIVAGVLSLMILAWRGFELSLGPIFESLLGGWDGILANILGWFGRWLSETLASIWASFGWEWPWRLDDQWRHYMAILMLYFTRDAAQLRSVGALQSMIVSYAAALVIAPLFAIWAGLISANAGAFSFDVLLSLIPIVGFFAYAVCMALAGALWSRAYIAKRQNLPALPKFWPFFFERVAWGAQRAWFGVVIALLVLPFAQGAKSPALVALGFAYCALALEWLRRGVPQARAEAAQNNVPFRQAFITNGNTSMGTDMLAMLGLAVVATLIGVVSAPPA